MKVDRTELVAALDIVKAACASKAMLDEFTHIWFENKHLVAYDDVLGIRAPFDSGDLAGGVKGALIIGLLAASGAKTVTITPEEDGREALMKAAGAKAKLALLPTARALWTYPKIKEAAFSPIAPDMVQALDDALIAVGTDVSNPDHLGVTMTLEKDGLTVYSTDAKTIARSYIDTPKGYDHDHLVLPVPFIEQVLRLCAKDGKLAVQKSGVYAETKAGVGIFGRQINSPEASKFAAALDRALPKKFDEMAVPIPGVLKMAIERALVILDGKQEVPIIIEIKDNNLHLEARSDLGEIKDDIELEGAKHPDVVVKASPALLKRGLDRCDKFMVADACVAMLGRKEQFLYVCTTVER